ncbi:MAG: hypothetical protein ACYTHM_25670 [Planctomycetota bacterium]|jgi:hypothetical protein
MFRPFAWTAPSDLADKKLTAELVFPKTPYDVTLLKRTTIPE